MKKTTLKTRRQKNEYGKKKDDDSLLQKNVCLIMMTVSSIVVEYAFMKIINSTCYRQSTTQHKKTLRFFYTFTHAGLARKKKEKEE